MRTSTELTAMCKSYKDIQQMMDELKAEQDKLKEALKAECIERGVKSIPLDGYTIQYSKFSKTTIDGLAVKAIDIDIYNRCSNTTTVERVAVR